MTTDIVNAPLEPQSQSDERIVWRRVALLGLLALAIFAVGAAAATFVVVAIKGSIRDGEEGAPAQVRRGDIQVGIVEQRPIELETRAQQLRRSRQEQLGSYGWVDREKNVIRIPIDEAMKQLAQEHAQ